MVAITGSNGKTTTTTLMGEILKADGRPTLVGGNIGRPVTEMVAEQHADRSSVERAGGSSFQLETTVEFKPRIAVVLNITPDHLDRHGSFEAYAAAKARITERQTAGRFPRAERRGCADADGRGEDQGADLLVQREAAGEAGRVRAWREHLLSSRAKARSRSR